MSAQYKAFLEEKQLLEKRQAENQLQLKACENDIETLRHSYSKSCDHPTRVLQFPVCGICYAFVPSVATDNKEK